MQIPTFLYLLFLAIWQALLLTFARGFLGAVLLRTFLRRVPHVFEFVGDNTGRYARWVAFSVATTAYVHFSNSPRAYIERHPVVASVSPSRQRCGTACISLSHR